MSRIIRQAKLPNGTILKTGDRCLFVGKGSEFICKYRNMYIFYSDELEVFSCDAEQFKKYVRAKASIPTNIAGTLF